MRERRDDDRSKSTTHTGGRSMYRFDYVPRLVGYPYPDLRARGTHRYDSPLTTRQRIWLVAAAVLVVGAISAAYAVAATAAPAAASKATCTPGVKTIGGSPARVFCGPARATAKVGPTAYRFAGGACLKAPGFSVNIGTLSFASNSPVAYFGISLPRAKAGTYTGKQVTLSFTAGKGRHSLVSSAGAKLVLAPNLHSGTFAGKDLLGKTISGSFTC
jgi:hypothetical protein